MRTIRAGSIQSKLTCLTPEFSAMTPSQLHRNIPHLVQIRAAHAILHRPPDRWTEAQRRHPGHRARKLLRERCLQLRVKPFPRGHILCDDDGLRKEVVLQLNIEWQIEADRAPPDIGTPSFDIGIAFEQVVKSCRHLFTGVDRGILRQPEIDQKLRAVRGRKELPWYEGRCQKGKHETSERRRNGDPPRPHGADKKPAKDAQG